jgi:hypothetical protein
MYNKYSILILILIVLILIILKSWNLIIFGSILIVFVICIRSVLLNTKNNNKLMEKMYCRKSDIHNPMGNVLLYTKEEDLEYDICPNEDIEKNLRFNIYNDRKDLLLKKNNVRSFITMPSSYYPNDIDNFKNNLYFFNKSSCKLNGLNCAYNEDIKYHKNYFLSNEIKTNT